MNTLQTFFVVSEEISLNFLSGSYNFFRICVEMDVTLQFLAIVEKDTFGDVLLVSCLPFLCSLQYVFFDLH